MNINKANNRDRQSNKRKNGMRVSNKSIFVIQNAIVNRGENAKKSKKSKKGAKQ